MFITYNAWNSTTVQLLISALQKHYVDLMDDSRQAIIGFKVRSYEICKNMAKAYKRLIQGKEEMALNQIELEYVQDKLVTVSSAINTLSYQLSAYAES